MKAGWDFLLDVVGMFFDKSQLASGVLFFVAAVAAATYLGALPPAWIGPVLFVALALLLAGLILAAKRPTGP